MDGGSNSKKRRVEAQGESSTKWPNVNMELGALDCPTCLHPLRPPIFQCSVGHFICSSCRDKLLDKVCDVCNAETSFRRCFGMERVVQSIIVPCSNAKLGCTNQLVYYNKEKHEKMCPNGRCFCPETGCSFAGAAKALMYHLTIQHKRRLTPSDTSESENIYLDLKPGLHVLHRSGEDSRFFLFIMKVEPLGLAVSVVCVQPQPTEAEFTCDMVYRSSKNGDSQSSFCKIRSSSLSDGLPTGYDLIVPRAKVSEQGNTIFFTAIIRDKRESSSDSGSGSYSDSSFS